jgi:hypothetical protein
MPTPLEIAREFQALSRELHRTRDRVTTPGTTDYQQLDARVNVLFNLSQQGFADAYAEIADRLDGSVAKIQQITQEARAQLEHLTDCTKILRIADHAISVASALASGDAAKAIRNVTLLADAIQA